MLKPRGQSRILAQGRLTIIVQLPVTPSNEGKIIYMSKSGKDSLLPGHLHNSRKSTKNQVKQHSGVKQIMMHSWRQRSCNSIQLHQFNWVLKKSEVPTVVSWPDGGPQCGAAAPLFVRNCDLGLRTECPTHLLSAPWHGHRCDFKRELASGLGGEDVKALLWGSWEHSGKKGPANSPSPWIIRKKPCTRSLTSYKSKSTPKFLKKMGTAWMFYFRRKVEWVKLHQYHGNNCSQYKCLWGIAHNMGKHCN